MQAIHVDSWFEFDSEYRGEVIPPGFTGIAYHSRGAIKYFKNGRLHREDGPAHISVSGAKYFYYNDVYYGNNTEKWFKALTPEDKIKALFNVDEWK